jgi:ABC-type amino acid transport substrate-binding protein/mono/diheme cytochrome c family protein
MGWRFATGGRRTLGVCLLAALLGALPMAARPAAADAAPLRLCVDPDNLPFSSARPGAPGLYVEIGQAIATALGRPAEPVWSLSYWGKRNLRETLLAGQCDIAVGLPDEPDFMGPRVIFSRPILDVGYALLVPRAMQVSRLDDLAGKRIAVQFASPPQSLVATHPELTGVTVLSPEEAVARLAGHEADAAFIWGPSAGYLNHAVLGDAFRVIPVAGEHMTWHASIGFARKQAALRDAVDAVLPQVVPAIPGLAAKYDFPTGAPLTVASAGEGGARVLLVADETPAPPATQAAASEPAVSPVAEGKELFNGTCAHCHGPDAIQSERRINLRLLRHRYGDTMDEVFHTTVTKGRPAKGMPNWSGIFSEDDFTKILAYLKTVQQD